MNSSLQTDSDLLAQVGTGQADALSEIYDRYSRLVYSLALQIVGNVGQAEEITQDVFLQVWNKAQTFRDDQGKVITWLASITRNRSIDVLRRQQVRPEGHQTGWADGVSPDLADDTHLEHLVEINHQKHRVRDAIAQLPVEQQQVLAFAYFHGLSHQEIADATDQPLGTVKTRLRLAMQKLKHSLTDEIEI